MTLSEFVDQYKHKLHGMIADAAWPDVDPALPAVTTLAFTVPVTATDPLVIMAQRGDRLHQIEHILRGVFRLYRAELDEEVGAVTRHLEIGARLRR